ncbi:MAG: 4-hydroxy-tetrahydrodipicolinate reductase [Gaiellaceae bacterium]
MGRAIESAAGSGQEFHVRGRVRRSAVPVGAPAEDGWSESAEKLLRPGDVVIEFSTPAGARRVAELCAERGVPLVSGTTGLADTEEAAMRAAADRVPVVRAANFSLGVALLHRALEAALFSLPDDWDVEIIERHHRHKADSPSGTALALARRVQGRRGLDDRAIRSGRSGRSSGRPAKEIGMHSLRAGSLVGDHTVVLAGEGEWIELRHVAQDRSAFANGALAAARFAARAKPGFYTLEDVLAGR